MKNHVTIIGGGLAGCEAAWQLLKRGFAVTLFEMKPLCYSPAHKSPRLAELVCSNSLGSNAPDHAAGILKEELRELGSLILDAADRTFVPAGRALAVDRNLFSLFVEEKLGWEKGLTIVREEVTSIPSDETVIIATGPLTSEAMALTIASLTGENQIYFYDAISPIIEGDSIDHDKAFPGARYEPSSDDYLNCPLTRDEYERFWQALCTAEEMPLHAFEDMRCFESCLPIEVLAGRGFKTLAFGPMKPVGLVEPRTGARPYAVVQLRREDREGRLFNIVGFQTKMLQREQERVIRLIPGLEHARFARYGSIHRNTFIASPRLLDSHLRLKGDNNIFFAGQLTGVEGYMESTAMGLLAGVYAAGILSGRPVSVPPADTAIGSLLKYVTSYEGKNFQPMNINMGLFPPLEEGGITRKEKGALIALRALNAIKKWKADQSPLEGDA
ncbi:MAG: methylenetetrahydrofolate--tRNA-(uracil(54)-C(5))-methyltransferase (FADH(2)-oxidizing) TrmFO [Desulfuromonadales bacterium]|nr:methylenetetrahydrofolate--tRNA-(uracil(54)-C(5))-methyltransferase (FADH(2)-oxidizing) TrmFO [Desulfuromonadales bacterium]